MRAESAGAEAGDAASAASAVGARDAPPSPLLARDTGLLRLRHPRQRRRFLRRKHLRPRALCRRARVTALAAPLGGPPPTHLGPPSRGAERSRSRTDECAPTAHGRG